MHYYSPRSTFHEVFLSYFFKDRTFFRNTKSKNISLWLKALTGGPIQCMVLANCKCAVVTQVHLTREYQVFAQVPAAVSHYFQWQWKTIETSLGKLYGMLWQV